MRKYMFLLDILFAYISLYFVLYFRYGFDISNTYIIEKHYIPFTFITILLLITNYIVGKYDRNLGDIKEFFIKSLTSSLYVLFISISVFYFIPKFFIAPKTNLVLFLFMLMILTNLYHLYIKKKGIFVKKVYIYGEGDDFETLTKYLKESNDQYYKFEKVIDFENDLFYPDTNSVYVIDTSLEKVKQNKDLLYKKVFEGFEFIELKQFFEDTLKRIPLSSIDEIWFMTYLQRKSKTSYIFFKRSFDILASVLLLPTFLIFPFVLMFMYIEDGKKNKSKFLIYQKRVGLIGRIINIPKIRSRAYDDPGVAFGNRANPVTRMGRFLRPSRIDELPQILSVIKGDLSYIGPRPEIGHITEELSLQIPFFKMRTLVSPGLSGWAQINQDYVPSNLEETKLKLSYDLYYIKHRSIWLELQIILKTIRTILSRVGS